MKSLAEVFWFLQRCDRALSAHQVSVCNLLGDLIAAVQLLHSHCGPWRASAWPWRSRGCHQIAFLSSFQKNLNFFPLLFPNYSWKKKIRTYVRILGHLQGKITFLCMVCVQWINEQLFFPASERRFLGNVWSERKKKKFCRDWLGRSSGSEQAVENDTESRAGKKHRWRPQKPGRRGQQKQWRW